jgi:hypothetical protein
MVRFQKLIKNLFLTLHGLSTHCQQRQLSIQQLRDQITHAVQAITVDMLHNVWNEFDYRVDVCRVTQGAHIEGS